MRSFDEMPTLAQESPSQSPRRRPRSWVRRCERSCMACLSMFPLVFVYGLTSWACWVQATIGFLDARGFWAGPTSAVVGIIIFGLLNWSYTTAVFTDPGSPLNTTNAYAALPSREDGHTSASLTVKSTGEMRFCKKCQTRKPDRAHHCSTCRRCVLKMDHHCPWLATCVGLRNYKPFLLFLIYTCIFCFHCFAVSGIWVWTEIVNNQTFGANARLGPVNFILLAVLAGILGLVLSGFTGWHIYLTLTGQTTIESLEKNRYISPLRRNLQAQLRPQHQHANDADSPSATSDEPTLRDHIREIHANAIPGVTRPEEGEERSSDPSRATSPSPSPALNQMRMSYADMEAARERARYASYLDELDSAKLPNAFDQGWRANLRAVLGPAPWLWGLPVCNTPGDGWRWEPSPRWLAARDDLARQRDAAAANAAASSPAPASWGPRNAHAVAMGAPPRGPPPGAPPPRFRDDGGDDHDVDGADQADSQLLPEGRRRSSGGQWNDVPEDMLNVAARGPSRAGMRPRSPRPARAYPDR